MPVRKSSISRAVEVTAEYEPISSAKYKGLVIYRAEVTEKITATRRGKTTEKVLDKVEFTGICRKTDLDKLLSGDHQSLSRTVTVKREKWGSEVTAVKPEVLTQLQRSGWPSSDEEYQSYREGQVEDPLTAMQAGEPVEFLVLHSAWNQASDINDNPLPVALYFFYINGGFHEGRYDLLKAVKILMGRKDVALVPHGGEDRRYGRGKSDDPKDPETYIGNIPYYNAEPGHSQCIAFHWHPSVEDYRKVYAQAETIRPYPGTDDLMKACFDTDILGLRAGGAARYDDYWKDRRYEKQESESDEED